MECFWIFDQNTRLKEKQRKQEYLKENIMDGINGEPVFLFWNLFLLHQLSKYYMAVNVVVQFYPWFKFYFLCFKLIIIKLP